MASSSQLWEEIVATALVGTERQALPARLPEGRLGEILARLDTADPPRALLSAAAAIGIYRLAGWLPGVDSRPAPEPCGPETTPRCPPRAAQRLRVILAGDHLDFLPEWLRAAAAAGIHVPAAALPELLERARSRPELWELLAPVAGERGRWLAGLNPEWKPLFAAQVDEKTVWETGSRPERLALLQRLRASDPAAARERVASTWATDPPEDRARFLAAFEAGLSMADEPFLEAALDDRRKEVRQAAAELLARLPGSGLCRRMTERLLPLLRIRRSLRGQAIEVQLPEACDKALLRDGVDPHGRREGLGEKASLILQMLGAVPPSTWESAWQQTPAALIPMARGEWQIPLLAGWSQAAQRHGNAGWSEPLIRAWLTVDGGHRFRDLWWGLLTLLRAERWERLVLEALRGEAFGMRGDHAALLREVTHPWSPELTRAVMDGLRRHLATGDRNADYEVRELLREAAHRIPPALAPEVAVGWTAAGEEWGAWEDAVGAFLARLQFRHDMLREFQ